MYEASAGATSMTRRPHEEHQFCITMKEGGDLTTLEYRRIELSSKSPSCNPIPIHSSFPEEPLTLWEGE